MHFSKSFFRGIALLHWIVRYALMMVLLDTFVRNIENCLSSESVGSSRILVSGGSVGLDGRWYLVKDPVSQDPSVKSQIY